MFNVSKMNSIDLCSELVLNGVSRRLLLKPTTNDQWDRPLSHALLRTLLYAMTE